MFSLNIRHISSISFLIFPLFPQIYNGPGTSCVARNLVPGSTYYCVVRANSAVGQSTPSEVTVYNSPPAPPGVPANIVLVCLMT